MNFSCAVRRFHGGRNAHHADLRYHRGRLAEQGNRAECRPSLFLLFLSVHYEGDQTVYLDAHVERVPVLVSQLRSGFDQGSSEVATSIMANEELRELLEAMQTVTRERPRARLTLAFIRLIALLLLRLPWFQGGCCGVTSASDWGGNIPQSCECRPGHTAFGGFLAGGCRSKPQVGPREVTLNVRMLLDQVDLTGGCFPAGRHGAGQDLRSGMNQSK